MKQILFLFICSFLQFSFIGENSINDLEKDGLKGKVKSVKFANYTFIYDTNGYKIEFSKKLSDSLYNETNLYKHDNMGNIIEDNQYDNNGNLKRSLISVYDDRGNIILIKDSCHYLSQTTYENIYNCDGKIIEVRVYDSNNGDQGKISYTYDKKGNRILETKYYKDDRFANYTKYDGKGNIIEKGNLERTQKRTFKYNVRGYKFKMKEYNFDGSLYSITKFDRNGNINKVTAYKSSDKGKKSVYKYDKKGSIIKSITYTKSGLKLKTYFKVYYDKEGNWIKKISYNSQNVNKPYVMERQIEYY